MGRSSTLRPPSSGLTYREARELCNELMTRVQVSTRTYRWRRYDDVFSSGEAVNALLSFQQAQLAKLAENEAQAASQLQTLMDYGFIGRVSKKNDELTGLNEKHANVIKVWSRRPAVLRRLHAVDATRVHQTRSWVVSFSISRPFGPI